MFGTITNTIFGVHVWYTNTIESLLSGHLWAATIYSAACYQSLESIEILLYLNTVNKTRINQPPLLSCRGRLLVFPKRVFLLSLLLLNGHVTQTAFTKIEGRAISSWALGTAWGWVVQFSATHGVGHPVLKRESAQIQMSEFFFIFAIFYINYQQKHIRGKLQ